MITKKEWNMLNRKSRRIWRNFNFGPGFQIETAAKKKMAKAYKIKIEGFVQNNVVRPMRKHDFERI